MTEKGIMLYVTLPELREKHTGLALQHTAVQAVHIHLLWINTTISGGRSHARHCFYSKFCLLRCGYMVKLLDL
jgi:hypothetical protein